MKKNHILFLILSFVIVFTACENEKSHENNNQKMASSYDMRDDLTPSRLTIAMWDFSWLYMHYPGGAYEDWDKVLDELKERGFNTVRIDAFPLIIGKLTSGNQHITIPGDPLRNWGASDKDRVHDIKAELLEFMRLAKQKNINVILSTWNQSCKEFPDLLEHYQTKEKMWTAWEITLDLLAENNLLSHVLYVDIDQEFPYFSPFQKQLNELGKESKTLSDNAMEEAGKVQQSFGEFDWNPGQMNFVYDLFTSTLNHFQYKYPGLRFTFSLTSYWKEVRAMNIHTFDVLELHIWMTQSQSFNNRSGFNKIKKARGEHDYKDYMRRIEATMQSIRPMLLKEKHNRLEFAQEWSKEIGAPLTTTESWGPWWHMDHPDLDWQWLYDWCEECMALAPEYSFWGVTPWNYSHPYWNNWQNVEWYQRVNNRFLNY